MRAGYRVRDARVASAAASRMLSRVSVRREYQRLLAEVTAPLQDRAAALVAHWFSTACADITDIISWDSAGRATLRPLDQMDAGVSAAISRLVVGPGGEIRVELGGRDSAMKALIAFLGLCQGRSAQAGGGTTPYYETFKAACPNAYVFQYDDASADYSCTVSPTPSNGFDITFCGSAVAPAPPNGATPTSTPTATATPTGSAPPTSTSTATPLTPRVIAVLNAPRIEIDWKLDHERAQPAA